MSQRSEFVVGKRVLYCTVTCHYQATTSEDIEDLMFVVVSSSVCRLVSVIIIICNCKLDMFNKSNIQFKSCV
jgi:hypothetical protein